MHDHQHDHDHDHHHHHVSASTRGAFAWGVALNVIYIGIELGVGVWIGSLMLLADAGHNLSDVLGLLLSWGAVLLLSVKPSEFKTYGYRSTTILAALANGLILMATVGAIVWEAVLRFWEPSILGGPMIMLTATAGIVINGITTLLFVRGSEHDINLRGAYLHMLADTLVSAGVVLAAGVIWMTGWVWVDPVISLLIAGVIFWSTLGLLGNSFHLALQGVPRNVNLPGIRDYLTGLPGVSGVSDLHVWGMSTTENALTVHLVKSQESAGEHDAFLDEVSEELRCRFGISHPTIQIYHTRGTINCPLDVDLSERRR